MSIDIQKVAVVTQGDLYTPTEGCTLVLSGVGESVYNTRLCDAQPALNTAQSRSALTTVTAEAVV